MELSSSRENAGCYLAKVPYFLVGDAIFPLKDWLMRPYPGNLDESQHVYNYRLSRARRFVENTLEFSLPDGEFFVGLYALV